MQGFWMKTEGGNEVHIVGDPNMPESDKQALGMIMDTFAKRYDMQKRSFDHLWEQGNNHQTDINKEDALWWFRVGAGWHEQSEINKAKNEATKDKAFNPDWVSPPGDTIKDCMREKLIGIAYFARRMRMTPAQVDALFSGEMPITKFIARKLELLVGGSTEFWINREQQYRSDRNNRENRRETGRTTSTNDITL